MLKKILLALSVIAALIGGTSFVFGYNFIFSSEISLESKLSPNIYVESPKLQKTVVGFKSNLDISPLEVHSSCEISSEFLDSYEDVYYFSVLFPQGCKNGNIVLRIEDKIILNTTTKLNFVTQADLFDVLSDYSTEDLKKFQKKLVDEVSKYEKYKNYNGVNLGKNYSLLKKQRKYEEAIYKKGLVDYILMRRGKKYVSPVVGEPLPENNPSKVPNAGRPYRAQYTDGIHHGWDVDAEK